MSRRAKYSHDVIQQALELRERGKGLAWIGRKLGMSTSAVDYHCLRGGAEKPGARAIKPRRRSPHVRAGVVVSSFSEAEDKLMLILEAEGASLTVIAKALGRRRNSVEARLHILARHAALLEPEGV